LGGGGGGGGGGGLGCWGLPSGGGVGGGGYYVGGVLGGGVGKQTQKKKKTNFPTNTQNIPKQNPTHPNKPPPKKPYTQKPKPEQKPKKNHTNTNPKQTTHKKPHITPHKQQHQKKQPNKNKLFIPWLPAGAFNMMELFIPSRVLDEFFFSCPTPLRDELHFYEKPVFLMYVLRASSTPLVFQNFLFFPLIGPQNGSANARPCFLTFPFFSATAQPAGFFYCFCS